MKNFAGYDVLALAYRSLGLLARFSIPLFLIYAGELDLLGEFYLVSSIIAAVSVFGGLELAMYYSAKQGSVISNSDGEFSVHWFIINLATLNALLLLIFFPILFWTFEDFVFSALASIALALEVYSFECGRYIWNKGQASWVSKRELVRPSIFASSIYLSIALNGEIVGAAGLIFFVFCTICFVGIEIFLMLKRFAQEKSNCNWSKFRLIRITSLLKTAGPQFIEKQVFAYIPVLERTAMVLFISPAFAGLYGFAFSIVSSGAHLIYLPAVVRTTEKIMSSQYGLVPQSVYRSALLLFPTITATCALFGVLLYLVSIFATLFFSLELHPGPLSLFVVVISASAYSYSTNVAALYNNRARFGYAIISSTICILPLISVFLIPSSYQSHAITYIPLVIALGSALFLFFRLQYFYAALMGYTSKSI